MVQPDSSTVALFAPISSLPLETINPDVLPAQLRELFEAEGDIDPSLEEIEQILEVIDLPADVKSYLHELAALAEQVRKWEKETEAFVQFLTATVGSVLTQEHLENVSAKSGVVQTIQARKTHFRHDGLSPPGTLGTG